jgi:hypothetical protein
MTFSLPSSTKTVAVVVDFDSALVRLILRSYLFLIFLSFSYIGGKCCVDRVKLQLMKEKDVKLTYMTGWLPGWTCFFAVKTLQTFPAGRLGSFMMMFGALLGLASDLAVTTLVQNKVIKSQCQFGTGLVVTETPGNVTQIPPTNAAPYFVVTQAQITSQANGGLKGIYAKANRSLNFSADATDVIGGWTCQVNATELEYPFDTVLEDIISDVQQHGLLYGPGPPWCSSDYGLQGWSHLVIWDSSVANSAQAAFDVRASIDLTGEGSDTKVMQSYECRVDTSGLDSILSTILSKSTLSHWCSSLQGLVYDGRYTPAGNDTGSILEEVLNSMVMVAGGNNFLLNTTATNETQGCLVARTNIHLIVIILTSVATAVTLISLIYWIVLVVLMWRCGKKKKRAGWKQFIKSIEKLTPGDVFDWMALAARESQGGVPDVKPEKLKKWIFGPKRDGVGVGISRDQDEEEHKRLVDQTEDDSNAHELEELGEPSPVDGVEPASGHHSSPDGREEREEANGEEPTYGRDQRTDNRVLTLNTVGQSDFTSSIPARLLC